jgi:ATP-dependent Clp protease, protease subunit
MVRTASPARAGHPFPPERPGFPPRPERPWVPSPGEPRPNPAFAPARVWLDPAPDRPGLYDRLFGQRIVMAHGHLDDVAATQLSAQLLTLDAEGDDPIRLEVQNLTADLTAALTLMGVLDVVGVPVQARVAGQISGAALGVLAACDQRRAYPNAVFTLCEPKVEFDGTMVALAAREAQVREMLDSLYVRLADVTGQEVDQIRDDARQYRILTVEDAVGYGLITERIQQA